MSTIEPPEPDHPPSAAGEIRAFADRLPHFIWTHDRHGNVDWINAPLLAFLGVPLEVACRPAEWIRMTTADDIARLIPELSAAIAESRTFVLEMRFKPADRPDTDARWFVARIVPVFDDTGDVTYWLGTATDIHQYRHGSGERLEDGVSAFAQAIPQLVWQTGSDGRSDFFNDRWYDYTGLTPTASLDDAWLAALHPEDVERTREVWTSAVRAERLYETEYRFRARDGTYRWFLARGVPMRDAHGNVVRWFGTCTDIDDTKRAQAVLVDSERQARVLADVLPTILWTSLADGTLTSVNKRWTEYTGLTLDESIDIWLSLIHPDDVESLGAYAHAFETGERLVNESRFRRFDGTYRWFQTVAEPVRNEAGTIVRWVGATHDVQDARDARDMLVRELEREHRASAAFQQAALPATLPEIPGLVFDAVYSAARSEAQVGGDWYDVFRLTDGRVVLSIGDVAGSGLDAAVTMGAVRQAIRGAAQIYPDPVAVLDAADRALRSEQPDRIVTAFAAVFDPLTSNLTYASAGHPAPLVRRNDGSVTELTAGGLPLGLRPARNDDASRTIVLAEDSLLVLYTDGLVEATRNVIEGEALLRQALERAEVLASSDPAREILDAVVREPIDDVAILTMHVGAIPTARWTIDVTDGLDVRGVRYALADRLRENGAVDEDVCTAELLFSELVGNVLRHSGGVAEVALDATGEYPVMHVLDRGAGFTFHARLPNDVMSESGRGLYIASMLARDLSVVPRPDGGSHARAVLPLR